METCSRNLIYGVFLILLFKQGGSQNFWFDFASLNITNLTLLGDSYVKDGGVVGLTKEVRVPSSSSGSIIYPNPILFFDKQYNSTASFSTRFTFLIDTLNPWSSGGGLSFFLSPNPLDSSQFIAVEFDTSQDLQFDDPDDNHVGLDIHTLVSVKTTNAMLAGINLKSGFPITAWIDYNDNEKELHVFLSYSSALKPDTPLLLLHIDLSYHLKEFMFIGFSASTDRTTQLHYIHSWSFKTFGFRALSPPRIHDHSINIPSTQDKKRLRLVLGVGVSAGTAAFLVMVFGWICIKKWKVRQMMNMTYKEVKSATGDFDSKNIIGSGGLSTVYKACFSDSNIAAVKRLKQHSHKKTQFLSTIAKLRHKNLLQLQGWCVGEGELLLVYDFMPNGSLDKLLNQEKSKTTLKWNHRYNIAVGLASVLSYLHQEQVIHRDLKASNVMLDSNYNVRLGDIGLGCVLTEKSDVYSYGVVILEVACGRRVEEAQNLVEWVWRLYYEGKVIEAADKRLNGEFKEDEMRKILVLGLSCTHPDSTHRPSMKTVFQTLCNDAEADCIDVPWINPALTIFSEEEDDSRFLKLSLRSDSI